MKLLVRVMNLLLVQELAVLVREEEVSCIMVQEPHQKEDSLNPSLPGLLAEWSGPGSTGRSQGLVHYQSSCGSGIVPYLYSGQ